MTGSRPGAPPGDRNRSAPQPRSETAPTGRTDTQASSPENSVCATSRSRSGHPPGTRRRGPGDDSEASPSKLTTGEDVTANLPATTDARALVAGLRRVAPTGGELGCPAGCPLTGCEHDVDRWPRGLADYGQGAAWRMTDGRPVLVDLREYDAALRQLEAATT